MNINLFDNTEGVVRREYGNSFNSLRNEPANDMEYNGQMSAFPPQTPLAMAYVPFQNWGETKLPDDALNSGTLFSDLVFPFEGCPDTDSCDSSEEGGVRR